MLKNKTVQLFSGQSYHNIDTHHNDKTKMKKKNLIILTVQPLVNKNKDYRLGMNTEDFKQVKPFLNKILELTIQLNYRGEAIDLADSLKTYKDYGNFVNPAITKWIKENNFHEKKQNKACKLIFEQKINKGNHCYIIYPNQKS